MEVWKNIPGFDSRYQVSNYGRVKSHARINEKILHPGKNTYGYFHITIYKNNVKKYYLVHRLILSAFMGDSHLHCNHKDGIKTNNRIENLEYVTNHENKQHAAINGLTARGENHGSAKLSDEQVYEIKKELDNGETLRGIAKKYNVSHTTIGRIKRETHWKHLN